MEVAKQKINLEVCESIEDFLDSDVFGSPSIFNSNSQMKKKQNLTEVFNTSDKFHRTGLDLKWLDKCDLHFKSVLETTISGNVLTFQDRKFSSSFSHVFPSELAIDDSHSISNINSNMRFVIPVDMSAGTGNISRNLCPRQHMDKISE
jgi:hypothetical protein